MWWPSIETMDQLCRIVKAFHGDIFGGYLRQKLLGETCSSVDFRIDPETLNMFLNVLSVFYNITYFNSKGSKYKMVLYELNNCDVKFVTNILAQDIFQFQRENIAFDVNMLVSNNNAMFIKQTNSPFVSTKIDRFEAICDRIKRKRFSLASPPVLPVSSIISTMLDAESMVRQGWVMDDFMIGNMSWLLNRWDVFAGAGLPPVRTTYNSFDARRLLEGDTCSLCHEKFSDEDVVLNTCCNHNFHWKCEPMKVTGILYWFQMKQEFECPYCRRDAISFLS